MNTNDKEFYSNFFKIAIPIIGLQLLSTSVNLLSSLMVGQLGESSIIAVGFCNQFFQMFNLIMLGICNGTAIFTTQYCGKKDYQGARQMFVLGCILTGLFSFTFFIVCQRNPFAVIGFFTENKAIITIGADYLKTISWSYLLTTLITNFNLLLQCTKNARYALISSVSSIIVSVSVSYYFIFYKGFDARGAAIGIVTAKTIELLAISIITFWRVEFIRRNLLDVFKLKAAFFPRYIKTVTPVVLNMAFYGIGTMLYSSVYGRVKEVNSVAAINIMNTIGSFAKIFMTGAAAATSVVIGREIGAGNKTRAYEQGIKLNKISPFIGLFCSLLFGLLTPVVVKLYNITPEVREVSSHLMIMLMISVIFETCNHIGLVGILKSGGDSLFNFIMDTIGVWGISLPLLYLTGIILRLDIEYVYGVTLIEIILKSFVVRWRIRQCNWAKNLVDTRECV